MFEAMVGASGNFGGLLINAQCVTHVGEVFFGKIPWRTSP